MNQRPLRKSAPSTSGDSTKRAVAYHGLMVTLFWIIGLFMFFGIGLTLLVQAIEMRITQSQAVYLAEQMDQLNARLSALEGQQGRVQPAAATQPAPEASAQKKTEFGTNGILTRGSWSPDGTKFAGYDEVTKGKMGVGVQVKGEERVRHVVLFDTRTERSDAAVTMSVRWLDNKTLEYDVMQLKGKTWTMVTQTVKIFF